MVETDAGERELTDSRLDLTKYSAIAVGPGIGQSNMTEKAFASLLTSTSIPLVIDADAINILARRQELFRYVPANSIFTPHPKEFERLTQPANNGYERLNILKDFCQKRNVYTILKGAYSVICTPDGHLFFNTTGNPAMAKAGMGDVLTGIITGLLAQGYSPLDASILGTYLHGKSADLKSEKTSVYSLLASEVVENLGEAFLSIV
jgi:NAD(P)H-hydrate epimerase